MIQRLDLVAMKRRSYEVLSEELIPLNYNELYEKALVLLPDVFYSDKTDPREKFRQFVSHENKASVPPFAYISKYGLVGLPHWFDRLSGFNFIADNEKIHIQRNNGTSFEAMKELIFRIPFMKNHYNDGDKKSRQDRRINAYLVESHIAHFFKTQYPEFYRNPTNFQKYKQPSTMDFFVNYHDGENVRNWPIDVKSFLYAKNETFCAVRKNKDSHKTLYVFGTLKDDFVIIDGFRRGDDLFKTIKLKNGTIKVLRSFLLPIDILLVHLNMAKKGWHYPELKENRLI